MSGVYLNALPPAPALRPAPPSRPLRSSLTALQWSICAIAAIGFAFDTYELLMLPLIVRPALMDLIAARPDSAEFSRWVGIAFYLPAVAGGIFGVLGGYLTDRFGRRRLLVWSIVLYAVSAFGSAYASSLGLWLALRCATFVGVCVEFVAAVAWLAELFPDPMQRERVIGYTQAFASIGGLMVSAAYYAIVSVAGSLPAVAGGHAPWRYMLISGVIPAIPLMIARPFLPESPAWLEKRRTGSLRRPSLADLFGRRFRRITIVTVVMVACGYAMSFGANLQVPRIVPALADVRAMSNIAREQTVGRVQMLQELGGLAGRIVLAALAVHVASRRRLIRLFLVPAVFIMPFVFFVATRQSLRMVEWGTFAAGFVTVAQFSFWGNYLPRVYPTYLRGTGESVAANIGGRMIGTGGALVTAELAVAMPAGHALSPLALAAGAVGLASCLIALAASAWLPEPGRELPD
jgi:MFS family permease